jgi:hypothetical protein
MPAQGRHFLFHCAPGEIARPRDAASSFAALRINRADARLPFGATKRRLVELPTNWFEGAGID